MTPSDESQEKLERLVNDALHELPLRRAPRSLESRVFAEIGRRAAMPWWRKSFLHWPLAARVGFLIASYGFVRASLTGVMWLAAASRSAQLAQAVNPAVTWLHAGARIVSTTSQTFVLVVRAIPLPWLYGGMACALALYVLLFGISAAAYRTLYNTQ